MLKTVVTIVNAVALLVTMSGLAQAQSSGPKKPGFELLLPSGTIAPTGAHGGDVKRANLTAVQLSYGFRPDLVVTSTVGWAPTRLIRPGTDAKIDVFTYDVGIECRLPRRAGDGRFNFKPFTGTGAGARSYNSRNGDNPTAHNLAAYVSAGGEIALAKVRLRLEVRDYMTWRDPSGGSGRVRSNDVVFIAGLRLGVR